MPVLKNALARSCCLLLIACGPAGTTMQLRPGSPRVAAQIEIVALRAAIPETTHVKEGVFRVLPAKATVTAEQAAEALVSLPKPVVCAVSVTAGIPEVVCRELHDFDSQTRTLLMEDRGSGKEESMFAKAPRELGTTPDAVRVLYVGRTDLIVSLADAEEWYQSYYDPMAPDSGGYAWSGDYLNNPYFKDSAEYVAAQH